MRALFQLGLRPAAILLITLALVWLAVSSLPGPDASGNSRHALPLVALGFGALLMWFHSRQVTHRPPRGFELSRFKHSTLADDIHGPDTHPMAPPESAFGAEAIVDVPLGAGDVSLPPPAARQARHHPTRWRAGVLRAIEWQRFEAVCAALFRQDGYITKLHSSGDASGIEIWLHSPLDLKQPVRIVWCKHAHSDPIDVDTVREFLPKMHNANVASGAIVTAGRFTDEARKFARRNQIAPVDSVNLLTVILRRSESQQQDLLAVATQGEYWRPTCPACHAKMVPSAEAANGTWTCSANATCSATVHWVAEAI